MQIQDYMLGKAVYRKCQGDASLGMASRGGLSLEEIATFIKNLGTLDAVAETSQDSGPEDVNPQEEALAGGATHPRLEISKSH